MTTSRQREFLLAYMGVTLLIVAGLASFEALALDVAVALSVIALLGVTALTAPVHVMPRWRRRLRWPLLAGTAGFMVLVVVGIAEKFAGAF